MNRLLYIICALTILGLIFLLVIQQRPNFPAQCSQKSSKETSLQLINTQDIDPSSISLHDGNLYVGERLRMFENPKQNELKNSKHFNVGRIKSLALDKNNLYVGTEPDGLKWLRQRNVGTTTEFKFVDSIDTADEVLDISVYRAGNNESLFALTSTELHVVTTGGSNLMKDQVFSADSLLVRDVTKTEDGSVQVEARSIDPYSAFTDIALQDGLAYVTASDKGVLTLDVSGEKINKVEKVDPGNSEFVRNFTGIATHGQYAFATIEEGGLDILDISNPKSPTRISSVSAEDFDSGDFEEFVDVVVHSNTHISVVTNKSAYLVNVSNLRQPKVVAQYNAERGDRSVAVDGYYLYLGSQPGKLEMLAVCVPK